MRIPLSELRAPDHPLRGNEAIRVKGLARSMEAQGQLQAVLVRETPEGYQVIDGRKRQLAALSLGWEEIEAFLVQKVDRRKGKTSLMMALELAYNKPIEELISKGTIYRVGMELGIHPTTVYYWRLRFGKEAKKAAATTAPSRPPEPVSPSLPRPPVEEIPEKPTEVPMAPAEPEPGIPVPQVQRDVGKIVEPLPEADIKERMRRDLEAAGIDSNKYLKEEEPPITWAWRLEVGRFVVGWKRGR